MLVLFPSRFTGAGVLTGLPVIMVTTTGAKSGKQRTSPLIGIPIGDDLAIIGGNFGQKAAPGWVHNLTANPAAVVSLGDKSVDATARLADQSETDETFAVAAPIYGGYAKYRERASHRDFKVFVLESRTLTHHRRHPNRRGSLTESCGELGDDHAHQRAPAPTPFARWAVARDR